METSQFDTDMISPTPSRQNSWANYPSWLTCSCTSNPTKNSEQGILNFEVRRKWAANQIFSVYSVFPPFTPCEIKTSDTLKTYGSYLNLRYPALQVFKACVKRQNLWNWNRCNPCHPCKSVIQTKRVWDIGNNWLQKFRLWSRRNSFTPKATPHTSYFPLVAEAFDMEYYSIQNAKETYFLTIKKTFSQFKTYTPIPTAHWSLEFVMSRLVQIQNGDMLSIPGSSLLEASPYIQYWGQYCRTYAPTFHYHHQV